MWKVRWEHVLCMLIRNLSGELSDLNSLWMPREGGRLEEYTSEKHLGVETHCIGFNSLSTYHISAHCDAFLIFKIPKRAFREYFLSKMTIVFVCILDNCSHFSYEWWTNHCYFWSITLLFTHQKSTPLPNREYYSFCRVDSSFLPPKKNLLVCLYWWKTISKTKELASGK